MRKLFLAPHNDDEALFGSYIIQSYKPEVVIITDSYIQPERGETACSKEARQAESNAAMNILGAPVEFLHVPDKDMTDEVCEAALQKFVPPMYEPSPFDMVFAPALEGGNFAHDIVARVADKLFSNVMHYSTYTKDRDYPEGTIEIWANDEMRAKKLAALQCYISQWNNCCRPYFTTPHKEEFFRNELHRH